VRARALAAASDFARSAGHVDRAREFCEESLAISRQLEDPAGVGRALHELGEAALEEEAYAEAATLFEEAIAVGAAAGLPAAGSIGNLGWVTFLQGNPEDADDLMQQSLELFRDRGHLGGILVSLGNLAETKLALGEPEQARAYLLEGFTVAREADAAGDSATSMLETAAALLIDEGALAEAARLTGASDALLETSGFLLHPAERRRRDQIRAAIQARLGAKADELQDEGREAAPCALDRAAQALAALGPP
jgi:tetratricopeptide (TPR) repeat protein